MGIDLEFTILRSVNGEIAVRKAQSFNSVKLISAIRTNIIRHFNAGAGLADGVVGHRTHKYGRVGSIATIEDIVARATKQGVVAGVAD